MSSLTVSHKFTLKMMGYKFLLPVRFRNPHNGVCSLVWEFLLDTGAPTSVVPEFIAVDAGHTVLNGLAVSSLDATWGATQETHHHTFIVEIMGEDSQTVVRTLEPAIFDCTTGRDHDPILGADNFLKHFRVEFDYPNESVTLHW